MQNSQLPGDRDWWRGAVIYQIYPRSFADSNGDGIGDLPGITARLDYVASLGVDAIWLSPFFKSPMRDFGYDVSDFRAVDPIFGTLDDFDALLARAHALGLRVIIDQVLSHTSDEHAWFRDSRRSRDSRENEKADWYVWADPQPDGTPPNNWLSVFGGSGLAVGRTAAAVLPAQLPCQPAGPEPAPSAGAGGAAGGRALLAGTRRRRLPLRCRQLLLPRCGAAQQPALGRQPAHRQLHARQQPLRPDSATCTTRASRKPSNSCAACAC